MKKYLIDTQILIWTIVEPEKLSSSTLLILKENFIVISQVSIYEIAIKQKIAKLPTLSISISQLIERIELDGFEILPIKNIHIASYEQIPLIPDHRDPFDILIIATAFSENLPIISADDKFKFYQSLINLIAN